MKVDVEALPKEILVKAVKLSDPIRNIYIALYVYCKTEGKSAEAEEIAEYVGHARAYVHMRLIQLVNMGLVMKTSEVKAEKGRRVSKFEVVL